MKLQVKSGTIEEKGRLYIPVEFKNDLEGDFLEVSCIEKEGKYGIIISSAYPCTERRKWTVDILGGGRHIFVSNPIENIKLDKKRRVRIPPDFLSKAGLSPGVVEHWISDVIIFEVEKGVFEVWEKNVWKKVRNMKVVWHFKEDRNGPGVYPYKRSVSFYSEKKLNDKLRNFFTQKGSIFIIETLTAVFLATSFKKLREILHWRLEDVMQYGVSWYDDIHISSFLTPFLLKDNVWIFAFLNRDDIKLEYKSLRPPLYNPPGVRCLGGTIKTWRDGLIKGIKKELYDMETGNFVSDLRDILFYGFKKIDKELYVLKDRSDLRFNLEFIGEKGWFNKFKLDFLSKF